MMRLHGNRRWLSLPVCMLVMALRLPLSLLIRYVCPDVTASAVSYDLAVMAQEAVLWLLPALFLMPWRTRRSGDRLPRGAVAAGALGGGALVQLSLSALRLLLPASGSARTVPLPQTGAEWALAAVAMVVVPAVCEEAFFRGCVTAYLRDAAGSGMALVLGTLIFALMHGDAAGLPSHLVVSLGCTALLLRTGHVWPGMLLHMGYNAMALVLPRIAGTPWLALTGLLPLGALAWLLRGMDWRDEGQRLTRVDWAMVALILLGEGIGYLIL